MLVRLWAYTGTYYSAEGRLTGLPGPEIEAVCKWEGEKGKALKAMVEIGWLDLVEGEYQVHDWQEHEGHMARYHTRAKKAAAVRYGRETCYKHATSTSQAVLKHKETAKQAVSLSSSPPGPSPSSIPCITGHIEETSGAAPAGTGAQGDLLPGLKQTEGSSLPPEALELVVTLEARIKANNPRAVITPTQRGKWAWDLEKMHRLDNHSWQDIAEVLEFSQQDQFWKSNILSGGKLREQWNKLTSKMAAQSPSAKPGNAAAPVKGKYDGMGVHV